MYVRAIKRTDGCTKKGTEKRHALISNYCAVCGKKSGKAWRKIPFCMKFALYFDDRNATVDVFMP